MPALQRHHASRSSLLHAREIQFPRNLGASLIIQQARPPLQIFGDLLLALLLGRQRLVGRRFRLGGPPAVAQRLPSRDALPRVQDQHLHEQVHALVSCGAEGLQKVVFPLDGDRRFRHGVLGEFGHARPIALGRRADGLAYQVDLPDFAVTGDVRRADDELGEDEADGPDVHGARVVFGAEEQLGRPVPAGDHVGRHETVRVREGSCETEIAQLHLAVGGDQQVVGLDVAVQHEVLVAEPDGAGQHAHPGFDVRCSVAHALRVFDEHLEVPEREEFEDQIEVLVLGREDREQGDDVGVRELLEVLELADGVGGHALGVFLLDLDLLDGHELVGIGAQVAQVDVGVGPFSEFAA